MTDSPSQLAPAPKRHNKWLLLIAAYKFIQAALIAAVGVGALRLIHKDVDDVFSQIISGLRFNPESRLVNFVLDKASLLSDPLLRRIGVTAFCYAALSLAEGIGLYLEQAWGEFSRWPSRLFPALGGLRGDSPPYVGPRELLV